MSDKGEPSFYIKSGDDGFANRQKNIFDQLTLLDKEKKKLNNEISPIDVDSACLSLDGGENSGTTVAIMRRKRKETRPFRGKESIFKRPESLPPRFKAHSMPDHQLHPEKWVKYSLGDVTKEEMSEKSNTTAALSFLQELAARKSQENKDNDDVPYTDKVSFKPKKKFEGIMQCESSLEASSSSSDKCFFRSSKLIMPEYVVGREKKRCMKKIGKSVSSEEKETKQIKLDHLKEEDDDVE